MIPFQVYSEFMRNKHELVNKINTFKTTNGKNISLQVLTEQDAFLSGRRIISHGSGL